jgi:hypothetical protein
MQPCWWVVAQVEFPPDHRYAHRAQQHFSTNLRCSKQTVEAADLTNSGTRPHLNSFIQPVHLMPLLFARDIQRRDYFGPTFGAYGPVHVSGNSKVVSL